MTVTRKLTSITTAVALAATALGPMSTSASADEGRHNGRDRDYGYSHSDRDWDGGDRYDGPRHRHSRYHRRHKDNTGKYLALGLGALMLGIIASEAGRH
jgi:hypothetical protein